MKEEEIKLNGKTIKIVTKLQKDSIEINDIKLLDDTIDLEEIIKEVKDDERRD